MISKISASCYVLQNTISNLIHGQKCAISESFFLNMSYFTQNLHRKFVTVTDASNNEVSIEMYQYTS